MAKKNGYMDNPDSVVGTDLMFPFHRLTWNKKKAKNFKWAKRVGDFYDYYYGYHTDTDRMRKLKLNYDLYAGRGEDAMQAYHKENGLDLEAEGILTGFAAVQHYPVLQQVGRAIVGEQQRRPLTAIAIDTSGYNANVRKHKRLELYQESIQENIINPARTKGFRMLLRELGIRDPFSMNPDEQQEFSFMLDEKVKGMLPADIEKYMRKNYKSPSETQAQKIMDFYNRELNVKYLTDEGMKHLVCAGEQVYRTELRHDDVYVELCNPPGFQTGGSSGNLFVEENEWAKYEQYLKYSDVFNRLADKMGPKEWKELEENFNSYAQKHGFGIRASMEHMRAQMESRAMTYDTTTGGVFFGQAPDIRGKDGQEFLKVMYGMFGSSHDKFSSIRHTHIAFKSLRLLYKVFRELSPGKVKSFWVDEAYRFNRDQGDIKLEEYWVPEVWGLEKLGTIDCHYFNIGPIEWQWDSLEDPWDVKLPYVGIQFNKMFDNTKPIAPLDFGKPFQYLINLEFAKINQLNARDNGKVMVNSEIGLPKDWTKEQQLIHMKYAGMLYIDPTMEGFAPGMENLLYKSVDLSTSSNIGDRTAYLQFLYQQLILAMSYNPSRMGQVGQYTAVRNSQQNIVQSTYQTEDIFATHAKVVENLMNAIVRIGRVALMYNDHKRTYLLDDMSIAELEINTDILSQSEIGVFISNSSEDFANLMGMKQDAAQMVGAGNMSVPEYMKMRFTTNPAAALNIAEEAQETAYKIRQEEVQGQERLIQAQNDAKIQMRKMEQQFEMYVINQKGQLDLIRTIVDSSKFAQQADIDKNMINDGMQREELKLNFEKEENTKDRAHQEKLKKMDVEARKAIARSRPKATAR